MATNSCISAEVEAKFQLLSQWTTNLVYGTVCTLLNVELTVRSITECPNTSTNYKNCLIKADIFNKAVQANIPSL